MLVGCGIMRLFFAAGVARPAALVALFLGGAACSGGNVASEIAKPPGFDPSGQTKCAVAKSQTRPLIVEWPSADRGDLEAQARDGLVVVRYSGCDMTLLPRCKAPGAYRYAAFTRKDDRITIRDADELYANVPLGAAKLEGKLASKGELNVSMTLVGKYVADRYDVPRDELEGDCELATHVVSSLTAGAFEFFAGADAEAGGSATAFGAGAGAKSQTQRELLNRDGDKAACLKATRADKEPPEGCGALLRLEVMPVGAPGSAKARPAPTPTPTAEAPKASATSATPAGPGPKDASIYCTSFEYGSAKQPNTTCPGGKDACESFVAAAGKQGDKYANLAACEPRALAHCFRFKFGVNEVRCQASPEHCERDREFWATRGAEASPACVKIAAWEEAARVK